MAARTSFAVRSGAADRDFRAATTRVLDLGFDLLALVGEVERAHAASLFGPGADRLLFQNPFQAPDKRVVDRVVHEQALDAQAHLAAVEEAACIGHLGGHVHVGVGAHDHRVAATQLEGDAFDLFASYLHDVPTNLG